MVSSPHKDIAEFTANRMRARYVVALSLIAMLTIISQWVVQRSLANQEFDSRVVNIAGRQRMLSQKITKTGLRLRIIESAEESREARSQLSEALSLWQRSHLGLQHGDSSLGLPGTNSGEIDGLFKSIEPDYLAMVAAAEQIIAQPDGSADLAAAVRRLSEHEPSFLAGMNAIVFRYDSEAKQKVDHARYLEFGLAGLTLTVLVLEARLIFAPAVRRMRHDMRQRKLHEADMERLFSASPTAMFLVDEASLTVVRANSRAGALMGYRADRYLGHPVGDFLAGDAESNREFLERIRAGANIDEHQILLLDAQGNKVDALASACRLRYAEQGSVAIGITSIVEVKKAQQTLEYYATFDEMTCLVNRRTGLRILVTELDRARRDRLPLSVCFADLDRLKDINDKFGHHEGDWMIRALAGVLRESIRGGDVAVRLGGDEFLLILHDCTEEQAVPLICRIERRLEQMTVIERRPYQLSASFGVARYDPDRHATPEDLVRDADNRMYAAKHLKRTAAAGARDA